MVPGEEPQQVLYLQGLALEALARHADAADAFAMAVEHGSPNPELLCRLGQAQLAAGRPAEADRSIQQALAMDPNYAPARQCGSRFGWLPGHFRPCCRESGQG